MSTCKKCSNPRIGPKDALCAAHRKEYRRSLSAAKRAIKKSSVNPADPYKAAVFGDLHFPWHKRDSVLKALDLLTPDMSLVIQVGDIYDQFSTSRFPRSHSVVSPFDEVSLARNHFEWFWGECRDRCPEARLVQLFGNHDIRPMKRILERVPEAEPLAAVGFNAMFEFPGVEVVKEDEFKWNDIVFIHGYLSRLGDHARSSGACVVHGHSHKPGILSIRPGLWEMDVGYLGDEKAPCFGYSAWKRAAPMTRALGLIDEHGPRLVLLP